ncbi:hypothetical protein [Nonomuraea sp. NPDC049141]|uniref:hypothetical protein n=1 Tax=unclassified Nonomuraea TaxID=2593643 RepID=UPI0034046495
MVLTIDAWRAQRDLPAPLLAAAGFAVAVLLTPGQVLPTAMALFTAGLLIRYASGRRRRSAAPDHIRPALPAAVSVREG